MGKVKDITGSLAEWNPGRLQSLSAPQAFKPPAKMPQLPRERKPRFDAFSYWVYSLLAATLISQAVFLLLWDIRPLH